jgi:hypothetical protein
MKLAALPPLVVLGVAAAGCAGSTAPAQAPTTSDVCASIPDDVRSRHPLYRREAIVSVEPLLGHVTLGKASFARVSGAAVLVHAYEGEPRAWVERALECHLLRQSTSGVAAEGDPLTPPSGHASVRVVESEKGYTIEIRGDNEQASREILDRASALQASVTSSSPPDPASR